MNRRSFLGIVAAAPFAFTSTLRGARAVPVGLELYSVRTELAKDLPGTVAAVGRMGYQVVEFYAPYFDWTTATANDMRKVLDDNGLVCRSTHNNTPSFTADGLKKAIELNRIIGSTTIVMASAPRATTIDAWKAVADQLTSVSQQLKPFGMTAGYHNHQIEWRAIDGARPIDVLAAGTPTDVVLQFDVGTCLEAGADPIAWIHANPGRIRSVHCKEWSAAKGYNAAFGEGDAPWTAIFDAVETTGGVEYYLIEQETGNENGGELAMAKRCLDNWRKLRRI